MQQKKTDGVIIKFDYSTEQEVGEIKKVVGLTKAKFLIPIIDYFNLDANPRSSKTGPVTDAIQDSIENDPLVFPFKTKGILLAASQYELLDRKRYKVTIDNPDIEGILDGGHNALAIGLYILNEAFSRKGIALSKSVKTWDQFKESWIQNRNIIDEYLDFIRTNNVNDLSFYVPIELLVPRDPDNYESVETFKGNLLEICAARNNNVQLQVSAKVNQHGYFDSLKLLMEKKYPELSERIEWKPNDGGDIKAQDIISLAWIPLNLITPVKDSNGKVVESVLPQNIYRGKGSCLKQFEKLMSSPDVTTETDADYRRELKNSEVQSSFEIATELPALYDYIYKAFPDAYNAAGGSYGRITAVKKLNEKRKDKTTPFTGLEVDTVSPEGFIVPLVYGLQALMEKRKMNGEMRIRWAQDPRVFLENNLNKIVANSYSGIFSMCDYDPQKIGKSPQSYTQALSGFKMAIAGLLD